MTDARETLGMRERLESFVAGGFSLQACSARAALGLAAVLILSGGTSEPDLTTGAGARLAEGAYSRLVDEIQDEADTHLGYGRLTIVDRSSTASDERARIAERIPGSETSRRAVAAVAWDGARGGSETFDISVEGSRTFPQKFKIADGMTCLVVGARPGAAAADIAGGPEGMDDVAVSGLHRWTLWREIGHCLGGASDTVADTFAALMSSRSPDGHGVTEAMALHPPEGLDPEAARVRTRALALASEPEANGLPNPATMGWGRVAELATRIVGEQPRMALAPAVPEPAASAPDEDEDEPDAAPAPR